jgi:ribosomal protein L40E
MIVGIALVLIGLVVFFVMPVFGWIPGALIALFGAFLVVMNLLRRGAGATAAVAKAGYRSATTKPCPACRARIPADARVCTACGYRYEIQAPA